MLIVFIRAVLLYLLAVLAMRMMGKREVGQLQPFELVVVIMIAEVAATPMEDVGQPIVYGVIPVAALVICHSLLAALAMRSEKVRVWLCGQPTVLIRDGVICEKQLRRMAFTLNDLMEVVRMGGVQDISQVETAVLETGGSVSVFPKAADRPLTPRDMGMNPPPEPLPLPLILDGEVQCDNLSRAGRDTAWLRAKVTEFGYRDAAEILFLSVDGQGRFICQGKGRMTMQQGDAQ